MENPKPPLTEYQGDSPRWGAVKQFFTSTALWVLVFQVINAAFELLLTKTKASSLDTIAASIKHTWKWDLGFGTLIGAWDAHKAYGKAKNMRIQHDRLVADNIAMRSQLNQTGQILRHVANEVDKGKIADSTLTVKEDAPPSHVARLEAEKAAAVAQETLNKA